MIYGLETKPPPKAMPSIKLDYTSPAVQGKVARRAFAQESLKRVTSPTSVGLLILILLSTSKSVYELDLRGHIFFTLLFTIDWVI